MKAEIGMKANGHTIMSMMNNLMYFLAKAANE